MSRQYDDYLEMHKQAVGDAFNWLEKNLPEILIPISKDVDVRWQIVMAHDQSKTMNDEYIPYDKYFYGNNQSFKVVSDFNKAWLLHIHRNPHHWQYWVLIPDDADEEVISIDMPYEYIIEMICDWWSFSFINHDMNSIFKWYEDHKNIKLSENTQYTVNTILLKIKNKLGALLNE